MENSKWGGSRPRSGRPRKGKEPRETISFSVDHSVVQMARELRQAGRKLNEEVELYIAYAYAQQFNCKVKFKAPDVEVGRFVEVSIEDCVAEEE